MMAKKRYRLGRIFERSPCRPYGPDLANCTSRTCVQGRLVTTPRLRVQPPGKGHLDGDEGIDALVGHGLQVARDAAIGLGELCLAQAVRDL